MHDERSNENAKGQKWVKQSESAVSFNNNNDNKHDNDDNNNKNDNNSKERTPYNGAKSRRTQSI